MVSLATGQVEKLERIVDLKADKVETFFNWLHGEIELVKGVFFTDVFRNRGEHGKGNSHPDS